MSVSSLWVVDQIDAGWASLSALEHDSDRISLPLSLLPPTVSEGEVLRLEVYPAPEETQRAHTELRQELDTLFAEDDGEDFSL